MKQDFDPQTFGREIPQQPGPAPVHDWDPPFCGDIDMRIARDGSWHYQGSPIRREAMVRLFASILRRDEDGCYYLVTPVEKVRIQVDDCPFVATQVQVNGEGSDSELLFTLNTGEQLSADSDHRLQVKTGGNDEPHPTLHVRHGLYALVSRSVFYRLVEIAHTEDVDGEHARVLGVFSCGEFFPLGSA